MNFKSDNTVPVSPEIIKSIIDANFGYQSSYGGDQSSKELERKLSEIFDKEVFVFLTSTGTASNCLALSSIVKPHSIIYASDQAHTNTDECGAPSFFTGGATLFILPSIFGKLDPTLLDRTIMQDLSLKPRKQKPGCISLTQVTELGTVYSISELEKISLVAKKYGLPIHMDGARFTNALVSLGCRPSEVTWKVGVDVLSLGATKNGAMCAEAVVFFNRDHANDFVYLQKRAGQLMSKTRFISCQFLSYFKDDLWLKNASHANSMAQKLAKVFLKHNFKIAYPVEANEVFVNIEKNFADYLLKSDVGFYPWGDPQDCLYRFVTSFYTTIDEIENFDLFLERYKQN